MLTKRRNYASFVKRISSDSFAKCIFTSYHLTARDDPVKSKKYTKKLAKLMEKRQFVASKQKELSNR